MSAPIRILLVDDDEDDQLLTRELLRDIGSGQYQLETAANYADGLAAIARRVHDVYLLDYRLGIRTGLELLEEGLRLPGGAPMILLTGQGDREVDEEAIRLGAADYLVKGQITAALLERSIRHALERARTLAELRASEERFRLLVECIQDYAIFHLTPDGTVASWNMGAERLHGYTAGEVEGQPLACFATEQDRQRGWPTHLLELARRQGRVGDEGWRVRKDGSRFWADVAITALYDDQGAFYGYAAIVRDMTERRRAEEERAALAREQAARTEAEAAVRARDEFLSVAAHELRTPVTSLLGATQLLLRRLAGGEAIPPEDLRRRLRLVEQQTRRMARLITSLLDLSRIQGGRLSLECTAVDLALVAREVVETARACTTEHTLLLEAPDHLPIEADGLRLEQVLTNLVDNAIKYSPHGGRVEVTVEEVDPDHVVLSVRDYGLGIPATRRARIFESFYRAHHEDHRSGLGIGLYISRQIVELHGGSIGVECPRDGGSRFFVRLPSGGGAAYPDRQPVRRSSVDAPAGHVAGRTLPGTPAGEA